MNVRKVVYSLLGLAIAGTAMFTVPLPDTGPDTTLPIEAMNLTDGWAARWDKCTLTYSVNPTYAPKGAVADLDHAAQIISAATGMHLVRVTDNQLVPQSGMADPYTGGVGQPDVIIGWAVPAGSPRTNIPVSDLLADQETRPGDEVAAKTELASEFRGRRGIIAPLHRVTGAEVVLLAKRGPGVGAAGQLGYALHELGHVFGLGHSHDSQSLMYMYGTPDRDTLSAADTLALKAVLPSACTQP